jgi:hypothetical protein
MESNINELITAYAKDTENAELNYQCGIAYESIGQTAAAISYFLRAAERTNDNNLAYECLLKIGLCFERQGDRGNTVRGAYQHAVCLLPNRPEAYFLLARHYERGGHDYVTAYMYAHLGLTTADFNQIPLRSWVEYPGKWGLIFEKSVSSWWWGKADECRALLHELKDNHAHEMDYNHLIATQGNLTRLGAGNLNNAHRTYWKWMHPNLRYKFPGSETIERSYSQVYQDLFILSMTNGKKNGTYIEVGAGADELGSNSKLLVLWGWRGFGIEFDPKLAALHRANRKNTVLEVDALTVDYESLCAKLADENGVIDYLQLDCEPSETTFRIMEKIPFDKYKFRVITYEHDHHVDIYKKWRQISRDYLKSKGYTMVVNDISPDNKASFEDWWVHADLVDPNILMKMKSVNLFVEATPATDYIMPKE